MKKKEGLPLERVAAVLFDPHGEAQPSSAELAAGGCFMKMSERGPSPPRSVRMAQYAGDIAYS